MSEHMKAKHALGKTLKRSFFIYNVEILLIKLKGSRLVQKIKEWDSYHCHSLIWLFSQIYNIMQSDWWLQRLDFHELMHSSQSVFDWGFCRRQHWRKYPHPLELLYWPPLEFSSPSRCGVGVFQLPKKS